MSDFPKMLYTEGKMITVEGAGFDYIIVDNKGDEADALEMGYHEAPEKPEPKKPTRKRKAE